MNVMIPETRCAH